MNLRYFTLMTKNMIQINVLDEDLLEKLAELEHLQWTSFSKQMLELVQNSISKRELEDDLFMKWNKNWVSYRNLSEKEKEKDREWASKVINILLDEKWTESKEP